MSISSNIYQIFIFFSYQFLANIMLIFLVFKMFHFLLLLFLFLRKDNLLSYIYKTVFSVRHLSFYLVYGELHHREVAFFMSSHHLVFGFLTFKFRCCVLVMILCYPKMIKIFTYIILYILPIY